MKILPVVGLMATATLLIAAPVPVPQNGDLFVGFRASAGTGASVSYLVNLGSDANFRNQPLGTVLTLSSLGDLGADLVATYGPSWHTREDLSWGIFGVRNSASPSVYGSRLRPSGQTPSTPWPAINLTARSNVASEVLSVIEQLRGYRGRDATPNSAVATLQPNASEKSSYNFQVATPGTADFGSLSQWGTIEANFGSGPSSANLDVYWISGSSTDPVRRLGYFEISSSGQITFRNPSIAPPVGDSDDDGQTDADEAVAGTDPNDPNSRFEVESATLSQGSPATLIFNAVSGRTYQLQYSETLGSWQTISTLVNPAAGTQQFIDNDPTRRGAVRGFYRIQVSQ